ncbi:MAG: hypothetical protein K9J27_05635 [Bacteroidales bacterium]|nr:hypothetical protein [Bacteroidales bacterium]MCF8333401.1 hypothetical protein [Bacteroidales bacterium]
MNVLNIIPLANTVKIFSTSDPEFWLLYGPVFLWLILVIILFIYLLRKFTFGKWKNGENPYKDETFGMPRGVFRGTLTLSLLVFVLLFETLSLISPDLEARSEHLFTAFELMIAFYFGSKVMHHLTASDKKKNRDVARVIQTREENRKQPEAEENENAVG